MFHDRQALSFLCRFMYGHVFDGMSLSGIALCIWTWSSSSLFSERRFLCIVSHGFGVRVPKNIKWKQRNLLTRNLIALIEGLLLFFFTGGLTFKRLCLGDFFPTHRATKWSAPPPLLRLEHKCHMLLYLLLQCRSYTVWHWNTTSSTVKISNTCLKKRRNIKVTKKIE